MHLVRTQNFPENVHFLPPDTQTHVYLSEGNVNFSENFALVLNKWSLIFFFTDFKRKYLSHSKIECFRKIVNVRKPLNIFAKCSFSDVWESYEYTSGFVCFYLQSVN